MKLTCRKSLLVAVVALSTLVSQVLKAAPVADLDAVNLTLFGPQSVTPGEVIEDRLLVMIQNMTSEPVGSFSIGLYLSSDPTITISDQLLVSGREVLTEFPSFGTDAWPGFDGLAIPGGWPVGPAYLGLIVDEFGVITEMEENNNVQSIPIVVSTSPTTVRHVPEEYTTITEAITAAVPGDTIDIGAGEYIEALVVDKDLVIRGAGWDQTILKSYTASNNILTVAGVDLVVEDLQFWASFGEFFVSKAIHADNSSMLVRDVKLHEINHFNIEVYTGALRVENIEMHRFMGGSDIGVRVFNAAFCFRNSYGGNTIDHVFDAREASVGLIEDNVIDGSQIYYSHGVRLMDDVVAVVRNNEIVGQHTSETQQTHQAAGIVLNGDAYADISYNDISHFLYGLSFGTNTDGKVYRNRLEDAVLMGVQCNINWYGYDGSVPDLGGGQYDSPGRNVFRDNLEYNVQNRSPETIYARWNSFGLNVASEIDMTIYDDEEDGSMGPVLFEPFILYVQIGDAIEINLAPNCSIIFEQVFGDGFASVLIGTEGPRIPPEIQAVPVSQPRFYDVTTDASYLGSVEVRVPYDESELTGPEANVGLYHYEGDAWVNITSGRDPVTDQVFGRVTSLSPFIVVELAGCCAGRVGDANGLGGDDPSIGDISVMIDALFITGTCGGVLECIAEADINQSGSADPICDDITIGDISILIDYLFIGGPSAVVLPDCL